MIRGFWTALDSTRSKALHNPPIAMFVRRGFGYQMAMEEQRTQPFDVAVLGAGSGGEAVATLLARGTSTHPPMSVVVFEPSLVGGECPFLACIPSKVLLAEGQRAKPDWATAIARRDTVTYGRNDTNHATALTQSGATLVRARAVIVGPGQISADGKEYRVDHIIVATGAAANTLKPGIVSDQLWTSAEALSTTELPPSLVIVGGGPIGCELSEVYARFGSNVTIIEAADGLLKDVEPEIGSALQNHLEDIGVTIVLSAKLTGVKATNIGYTVTVENQMPIECARVLVAIGKTPRLGNVGLETLGLDPKTAKVDDSGRLGGLDRVWAVGDVTALQPYTHGANAQASVVAENIRGGARSMNAAVMPRCVYTHPPVAAVGPNLSKAKESSGVLVARVSYGDIARPTTDDLGDGLLTVFADRATGAVIGASGIGRAMDELISQITLAIETEWSVERLQHIVQPFPTISQLVGLAYQKLAIELTSRSG
jgi:pyruvate/2-oxoglutarate dehydrogenase complex dihydrolipoamide dehydrogenase (E3) component